MVCFPALGWQTVSAFLYLFFTNVLSTISVGPRSVSNRVQCTSLPMGTLHSNPERSNEWEVQAGQGLISAEENLEPPTLIEDSDDLHRVKDVLRQEEQG